MDEKVVKKIMTRAKRIVALEKEIEVLRESVGDVDDRLNILHFSLAINHWTIPQLIKMYPNAKVKVTEESVHGLYRIDMDVDGVPFHEYTIGEYAKEFMK